MVAVFLTVRIVQGSLAPAWAVVGASDAIVAMVQIVILRPDGGRESRNESRRAAIVVAAVYGYFLIFAQFSFVELLRAGGASLMEEKIALGIMAVAGMVSGFLAAWRGASPALVRIALGVAAVSSGAGSVCECNARCAWHRAGDRLCAGCGDCGSRGDASRMVRCRVDRSRNGGRLCVPAICLSSSCSHPAGRHGSDRVLPSRAC